MKEQDTGFDRDALARDSDWLRHFLIEYAGEDICFDALLGRPLGSHPPYAQNVFEKDRLDLIRGIVALLTEERGSEAAAAEWLFHDPIFKQSVGSVPFDYLEEGEFWALALMHDYLKIKVRHQEYAQPKQLPTESRPGDYT